MRAFSAELAVWALQGQFSPDEPEYLTPDQAWVLLREEIAAGHAPAELGTDLAAWSAWVDHTYTRLHREATGTADYRLVGSATVEGKATSPSGQSFARVRLTVGTNESTQAVTMDSSGCVFTSSPSLDTDRQARLLAAISSAVQAYAERHRLVGVAVSLIELQIHPADCDSQVAALAASRAIDQAVNEIGIDAI